MRTLLKSFENIRFTYIAEYNKIGKNRSLNNRYETMLFKNLRNSFGDYICNHIWIREIKEIKKLNLKKGDKIQFSAVVKKYYRGDRSKNKEKYDYKLVYLRNIRKIT